MFCTRKISDDIIWVGADSRRLALFEGVYKVPRGISYNSYLLLDEKTVLFDTVEHDVAPTFMKNLEGALNGRSLDYIVVHHMEPDHAATIEDLVLRYPEATIVVDASCTDSFDKSLHEKVLDVLAGFQVKVIGR